jgi:threonine-phosphate decarboxylase
VDPRLVRVDCSSSVNPLGLPKSALRIIEKQASRLAPMYPDPECRDLRKSLCRYAGVDADMLAIGNGAAEIIYWFAQAFAKKKAVIPAPTFCEYELASYKAGARVEFVPLDVNFSLDPDSVIKNAKGADVVFLCNPNNPTGRLATASIKKIIESVDRSTMILLDECFIELVDKPKKNTLVSLVRDFSNLVILRSLTKSFGMAGLRLGYSVSSPEIAEKLQSARVPWNVNALAQAAGIAALADRNHTKKARELVKKEKKFLQERTRKAGLVPLESDANYFLVQLQEDSTKFRDRLLKKTGVLVRDCSTFTGMGDRHIRIAVKTHRENVAVAKALEAVANG